MTTGHRLNPPKPWAYFSFWAWIAFDTVLAGALVLAFIAQRI